MQNLDILIFLSKYFREILWLIIIVILFYMVQDYFFNCLVYSLRGLFGKEHASKDKVLLVNHGYKVYAMVNRYNFFRSTVSLYVYDGPKYQKKVGYINLSQKQLVEEFSMEIFNGNVVE
ncbi:hypothetical protein QUF75_02070 [Desulfococcaceae bacterium HSG7]|nr:hypothetical protein [Desulfococcaceae bacterium HSG7]